MEPGRFVRLFFARFLTAPNKSAEIRHYYIDVIYGVPVDTRHSAHFKTMGTAMINKKAFKDLLDFSKVRSPKEAVFFYVVYTAAFLLVTTLLSQ